MSSYPSSSKLASPEHSHTPLSQSLPASTGPLRGTSPSAAARLRARSRRLSVRQSRGQTEYGFYERLYPQYPEYGDTYDEEDRSESEDSEEDPAGGMELDDPASPKDLSCGGGSSQQSAIEAKSKGKGPAAGYAGRDGKRRSAAVAAAEDRMYNLNARRPIITLRRDSGWDFSQDAFFPSYAKEQYTVARLPEGSESSSYGSSTSSRCCGASLADCDCFDEDLRKQPHVVEIYLTEEDRKRFFCGAMS